MPIIAGVATAAIGGAVAVNSAHQQKKAAGKALDAQTAANQQAQAAQQAQFDRVNALQTPFATGGAGAFDQLLREYQVGPYAANGNGAPASRTVGTSTTYAPPSGGYANPTPQQRRDAGGVDGGGPAKPSGGFAGVSPTSGGKDAAGNPVAAPGGDPAQPQGPQPDWDGFLAQNPDVVKYYNETPDAQKLSIQDFAKDVYAQQKDVRNPPPMTTGPAVDPHSVEPTYTRPDQPEYQGNGSAPSASDYFGQFEASPGYQFRLNEGMRNLNAGFGARGLLKSGAALKGAIDYGQGAASAEYGNWFNQQSQRLAADRGQFNTDRSANYNIFNTDRDNLNANFDADRQVGLTQFNNDRTFSTGREDNRVNNLFRLAGIGTGAAASIGGAGSDLAGATGAIAGNQAGAIGQAASDRAGANAGAVGAIGGAAANIFNRYAPASTANGNTSGAVDLGSLSNPYRRTGTGVVQF